MIYLKADLELKQRALDRTVPTDGQPAATARPTTSSTSSTASDLSRPASLKPHCTGPGPNTTGYRGTG